MTYTFKLSRRLARLRASAIAVLMVTLLGCDTSDSFDPEGSQPAPVTSTEEVPSLSYAGGIPFGTSALPNDEFGAVYNGALRNIWPKYLLGDLAAIKARGGKVALMFAGPEHLYKDSDGHFSLSKWKARVDLFKDVDFSSYVADGTIIGHYLIDEPQDNVNWNGRPISPETVEEMARYSKARWPNMVTIARTWPDYLDNKSGGFRYLDASWAQYAANRFPNVDEFIQYNVAKAKGVGLALIVGLNLRDGSPTKGNMSARQIRSYGTGLLSSSYPCAFISWKYDDQYLASWDIRSAMNDLRDIAQRRSFKTCRGS
jgi:hypothetical protein